MFININSVFIQSNTVFRQLRLVSDSFGKNDQKMTGAKTFLHMKINAAIHFKRTRVFEIHVYFHIFWPSFDTAVLNEF